MDHAPERPSLRLVTGGPAALDGARSPLRLRRRQPLLRVLLGSVLRAERAEQGRTLADVASAARVSLPYLSEVERGRKEPSSEVLAAVCEALDLTITDLVTRAASALTAGVANGRSDVTLSVAA